MIIFPIKGKWFYLIRTNQKLEEYREIKPYYENRFKRVFRVSYDTFTGLLKNEEGEIIEETGKKWLGLKNGYSDRAPVIYIFASLTVGSGKPEWGAEKGKRYFILKIHSVTTERPRRTADDVEI